MNREQAEVIGLKILQFIVGDGERAMRFLSVSGMAPEDLRLAAGNEDFLSGLIDYLLECEPLLLEFCSQEAFDPEVVWRARRELPGGQVDF